MIARRGPYYHRPPEPPPFQRKGPHRWEKFAARIVRDVVLIVAGSTVLVAMLYTDSLWRDWPALAILGATGWVMATFAIIVAIVVLLFHLGRWVHWATTTPAVDNQSREDSWAENART